MIHIVGTSHVAKDSVKAVKEKFNEVNPDIVALELDPGRTYSLKHSTRRPKNIELFQALGLFGFIFYVFGEFVQRKLGQVFKIQPGTEMLTGLKLAEQNNKKIFLIDRDIQITLRRLSSNLKKLLRSVDIPTS